MRSQPMPHPSSGKFRATAAFETVSSIAGGTPAPHHGAESGVPETLAAHLGPDAGLLPVTSTTWPPFEHVNVQGAVDTWLARHGAPYRLVGLTGFRHRSFGLSDLFQADTSMHMGIGGVPMTDQPSGPGEQTRACVQCGLYLIEGVAAPDDGDQTDDPKPAMALLLRGLEHRGPQSDVSVEIACTDRAVARAAIAEFRRLAVEQSVYRGHVLEFGNDMFGPHQSLLSFRERPTMQREELILPPGMLEGIEGQILGVNKHRATLLAHGQHLKRGVLLFGPPGTGKTHTVRYLMSRLPETTVVVLTGNALGMIKQACEIARALEPALVVVEDVDLIAQDRSMGPHSNPLLFQMLNEMDGLDGDADVTFVLTTNRVDVLEPALAMRPGRVDHAVEVPLPDAGGRRRLLELYRGGLDLDLSGADELIERMEGVTASFIKELIRRAALIAAEERAASDSGSSSDDAAPGERLTVSAVHLDAALYILAGSRHQLTRRLLGAPDQLQADPT
ncbi:MAG: 26S protease regulatory subunit [Catenulispora sp.]|nr:26S protease regulatory subunit [Catenulispora sp.]